MILNPCMESHQIKNLVELSWMYMAKLDFLLDGKSHLELIHRNINVNRYNKVKDMSELHDEITPLKKYV